MRVPTSLQQETWIRSLATGGRLRAMPVLGQIDGDFDLTRYRVAVAAATAAHDALRTRFRADQPASAEVVDGGEKVDVRYVDLRDGTADLAPLRLALTDPFPLDGTRRIRTVVAQTGQHRYLLGLAADHLAMDGLSLRLLVRDVLSRYTAADPQRPGGVPRPRSYADFAHRQRDLLAGDWGAQRRAYWFRHFDRWGPDQPGCPLAVPAAPDRDPSAERTVVLRAELGPQATQALDATARRSGSTRFSVLTAAVSRAQLMLSDRAVAGVVTDFHGRVLPGTWSVIGLFSHGLSLYLDRSEAEQLPAAVATLTRRLNDARRFGCPLRPLAGAWLAERGREHRYGEPYYIYLGIRPRLKGHLPGGSGLRAVPAEAGSLLDKPPSYLSLILGGTPERPVLEGRFNPLLFPTDRVEELMRTTFQAIDAGADLDISTADSVAGPTAVAVPS